MVTIAIILILSFVGAIIADFTIGIILNSYEEKLKAIHFLNDYDNDLIEKIRSKTTTCLMFLGLSFVVKISSIVGIIMLLVIKFLTM